MLMMYRAAQFRLPALCLLACALLAGPMASCLPAKPVTEPVGQRKDRVPDEVKGIGIDEHAGSMVPLDLTFVDETGNPVQLKKYFTGKRPIILQLGYFQCPMLCGLISQGAVQSLKDLDLKAGSDYDYIFVSINPDETSRLAYLKKKSYIKEYDRPLDANGWHFLTGKQGQITQLADAIGFKYKWVESQHQYSHPAALILLAPDGKISRYLYGVKFPEQTLRLSLVEASQGKIGTTADRILLTCLHFDASTGKYTYAAMNLMRLAGIVTVLTLLLIFWRAYRRQRGLRNPDVPLLPPHGAPGHPESH
jgi:protein SCO1/2